MQFNNRHNERVVLPDGRVIWLSRSVALVGIIVLIRPDGSKFVLMNKRGPGCPDEVGKWVLPCGYLDWDESGDDACRREIWEETGCDITELYPTSIYNDFIAENGEPQPFYVRHKPRKDAKQNVSHYHGLVAYADKFPVLSPANCEPDEVEAIEWVNVDAIKDLDIGFNHEVMIEYFFQHIFKNIKQSN